MPRRHDLTPHDRIRNVETSPVAIRPAEYQRERPISQKLQTDPCYLQVHRKFTACGRRRRRQLNHPGRNCERPIAKKESPITLFIDRVHREGIQHQTQRVVSEIVDQADTEAQMVAIVSHEMSHELHNDFAFFWRAAKMQQDSYGNGGLLERSRAIEQRADFEGARMMYNAGWDPKAQIEVMTRIAKLSQVARGGHRVFYSTHPDDPDRIASDEKEIDQLPPKAGLIEDSPRFQGLKKKL